MMMTGIALFAIMVDRSPFSLHMVALAALVILLSYPESLMTPSFQMSFAAVTALVAFYDYFRPQMQFLYREAGIIRKAFLYIFGIAVTTVIAGAATSLFGIYHFQTWSLYSTLANIMAMPVMALLVMPLAVLSYILMPLGLADFPLLLMGEGVGWVLSVAHYVAAMDGAVIRFMAFGGVYLGLLTFGLLLVAIGPRLFRVTGLLLVASTLASLYLQPITDRFYIADDAKISGYYDHHSGQFYVSSLRSERFIRENWTSGLGLETKDVQKLTDLEHMQCGGEGCRLVLNNLNVAWPKTDYAIKQDCLWADILISETFVPRGCQSKILIDRGYTRRNGAVTISLGKSDIRLETVNEVRGKRPWAD